MAEAAKKISEGQIGGPVDEAAVRIRGTHTEELVIGICGPIGSGHHELTECLKERLADFNYEVEVIRLSKVIEDRAGSAPRESRFDRVKALQDKGNELRKKYRPDYLASKAIEIIALERQKRKDLSSDTSFESRRKCYIIDSIKHPAEYEILELTYREIFYCFGIYAPLHVREQNLRQQGMSAAEIYRLVDRDSGEEIEHGQQVRDAFVKSDFFLRLESSNYENLKNQAARYLTIVFGTSVVTPTPHESAMHHAWVAAANSACGHLEN